MTRRVRTTWAECVGNEIYVKRRRRRPNRRYLDIVNKDTQDVGARLMFDNVILENALWRPLMGKPTTKLLNGISTALVE